MKNSERFKLLFGPYQMPPCGLREGLFCEMRGWVPVTGVSDGQIAWPQTTTQGDNQSLILCGDLVKAVKRESQVAVSYWWGVHEATVYRWRKTLGVPKVNEGTERLCRDYVAERWTDESRRGRKHSLEARQKMSEAHRRRGTRPPGAGRPWTPEEDALLGTTTDLEVARRIGRRPGVVLKRRRRLGIPAFCRPGRPHLTRQPAAT